MGFVLWYSSRSPRRLYAALHTIAALEAPAQIEVVLQLLQPPSLAKTTDTAEGVLKVAEACGLIERDKDQNTVCLSIEKDAIADYERFRLTMQNILLGHTDPDNEFYLLNQFAAWYAIQNERIFQGTAEDYGIWFQKELYGGEMRFTGSTRVNGWLTWATFLGWGWNWKRGRSTSYLIPDATRRVRPIVWQASLSKEEIIPFGDFLSTLAQSCPELDGGVIFDECWRISKGDRPSNRLSLMLSTALRTLHQRGEITLHNIEDASQMWHLYTARGQLNTVTHISGARN